MTTIQKGFKVKEKKIIIWKKYTEVNYCNSSLYLTVSFLIDKAKMEIWLRRGYSLV